MMLKLCYAKLHWQTVITVNISLFIPGMNILNYVVVVFFYVLAFLCITHEGITSALITHLNEPQINAHVNF